MASERFESALPRSVQAPGIARRWVVSWFAESLDEQELDTARLLTSELVSNAVLHGRGNITLRGKLDDDRAMVEVIDEGAGFERVVRQHSFEELHGRGLEIVDSEASRWGIHEGTTHVWFELERGGPRLGPETKPSA
ncbi:MAG TPA: ATP-binding protein [Solirubrobacteraceae bacterium]|jgi:anti-sigma regulatory factor (Ser/Thr protein kinase)